MIFIFILKIKDIITIKTSKNRFYILALGQKFKSYSLEKNQICKMLPKSFGVSCNHPLVLTTIMKQELLKLCQVPFFKVFHLEIEQYF